MKFQEPDLRGMSLQELRERNRAMPASEPAKSDLKTSTRTKQPQALPVPALAR